MLLAQSNLSIVDIQGKEIKRNNNLILKITASCSHDSKLQATLGGTFIFHPV